MASTRLDVCVIGVGPRGLSVLERLCANARHFPALGALTVHVVDPHVPGPGQVWRTDQSRHLLMNTVACQVTVFTDDSVDMAGPLAPGPSLYEWARAIGARAAAPPGFVPPQPGARRAHEAPASAAEPSGTPSTSPTPPGQTSRTATHGAYGLPDPGDPIDAATLAEAAALGPDTYPTRALYGSYLIWAFGRVVAGAPARVSVRVHAGRAVALDDGVAGTQTVTLEDGTRLEGLDAVVLAQGHLPVEPSPAQAELAGFADRHGLVYVPPANPADADLSGVEPGDTVLLRGLGLNFFDHMALLTQGRGGRYERRAGRLVYLPSGREPRLYAGSRRGMPYHARGENEKGVEGRHEPFLLTPELIAKLRAQAAGTPGLAFRETLWPLVAREVETVYYSALLTARGEAERVATFRERYLAHAADGAATAYDTAHPDDARPDTARGASGSAGQPAGPASAHPPVSAADAELLTAFGIPPAEWWDWSAIEQPYAEREFSGPDDFRDWLLDQLRGDLAAARAGNVSGPLKAALDVLRDLRNELRLAVDHGGLSGDSYRADLDRWYTPLNAYLSIGPPARRIEELVALIEAGTLRVAGPALRIEADTDAGAFVAESPAVPGSRVTARVLIEARLPEIDLRRTADPLLRHLLATGQCAPYRLPATDGTAYETGGLAVTERPYRLLDAHGVPHPRRFAYGVPTEAVHWVTAAGIRPGVGSVILSDSDAIARAVLGDDPTRAPDAPAPALAARAADR
ncbi:FAD/NAD(P)-binding protein [Streptomyces sp. 71268]|uniref:FAD/NAD(P)-binding protein n=1 Tax=Streptomyces sp. 71268 TaxID=3002640 RepID=UPI0023F978B5|nr:FAD/NAD(P)-binding protein [Streptomyces sp. 71268]WEV25378.1 FAD/NAD(P)-binding protein [Streptomyces sp. 71268]